MLMSAGKENPVEPLPTETVPVAIPPGPSPSSAFSSEQRRAEMRNLAVLEVRPVGFRGPGSRETCFGDSGRNARPVSETGQVRPTVTMVLIVVAWEYMGGSPWPIFLILEKANARSGVPSSSSLCGKTGNRIAANTAMILINRQPTSMRVNPTEGYGGLVLDLT